MNRPEDLVAVAPAEAPALRRAVLDPRLEARVVGRKPLHYAAGASPALDRPAHVRAASSLVRVGGSLVIAQDDAAFLAVIDVEAGTVLDVPLPAGPDGVRLFGDDRGNKADKLDLEAMIATTHDGATWIVAFGSGSSPRRERIVVATLREGRPVDPQVIAAPALYAALRANASFAGAELNVEGAVVDGDDVVFFQRGNGAARGGIAATDATARMARAPLLEHLLRGAPMPPVRDVTPFDLGRVDGARLTFTDAACVEGRVVYVTAAEASPDALRDGPVSGVAIGVIDEGASPRFTLLVDEHGAPCLDKVEGIVDGGHGILLGVVDRDDVDRPAELLEIAWRG